MNNENTEINVVQQQAIESGSNDSAVTTSEGVDSPKVGIKKCRVCGQPAVTSHTLVFLADVGFGWITERVFLCDSHAEHLDDSEIDKVYVKNRIAHLSRIRQKNNDAVPPKNRNTRNK